MAGNVRSVLVGSAYALVGALVLGGTGAGIGFSLAPDDGLQAVFNAGVAGIGGTILGGILGIVIFVAGSRAQQRQADEPDIKTGSREGQSNR